MKMKGIDTNFFKDQTGKARVWTKQELVDLVKENQVEPMLCLVCHKIAVTVAYGNSYCMDCFKKSEYYAEIQVKKTLEEEKKNEL